MDLIQKIILSVYLIQICLLTINSVWHRKRLGLGTIEAIIIPAGLVFTAVYFLDFASTGILVLEILGIAFFIIGSGLGAAAFNKLTFSNSDEFWMSRHKTENRFLVDSGPYSQIRHPVFVALCLEYLGLVLIFLHPLTVAVWLAAVLFGIYTSLIEEKYLLSLFPEYADYQKRTKKFIPKIY